MPPRTSYAEFTDNVAALPITGVKRQIDYPPASVNAADLPFSFVQFPSGSEVPVTFEGGGLSPIMRCQLVVLVEPVAQDNQRPNFNAAVDMMDAVSDALRDVDCGLASSSASWTIRVEVVPVAGADYWAVVAEVEARA